MIWFRRALTVPLILTFLVLFIVVLVITHVNGTVGSPGFYADRLREADVYNFLYDEVVPVALEEIDEEESTDFDIDVQAIREEAVSVAREALPPDWLQDQVESGIGAVVPYVVGDTDEFVYTVVLKDRVESASDVLKHDTIHSDAFTSLYDDSMTYAAEQVVGNLDEVPYRLVLTQEEMEESLKRVFTEDWAASQTEDAIDSVTPYLTGEADHFTITIRLIDRIDAAAAEVLELLSGVETYDYLVDELVAPMVASNLDVIIDLPFEVSFTQDEISSVIKDVLPQYWVEQVLADVINEFAAYAKGDADTIRVVVDLADREETALSVLAELADDKLRTLFDGLPTCSMAEFIVAAQGLPPGQLPDCRPSGLTYEQFKTELGIDVAGSVDQLIGDRIPRQWVYTDADLRQSLGEGNEHVLDDAREYVVTGWTYTDRDLRDDLDPDDEETLDDARDWMENGYTWTETDLREAIADEGSDIDAFDEARKWTGTARTWLWALWILPVLLLLFIGLLGGRSWRTKLAWALVVLLLTSLAFFIVVSVTYGSYGEPEVQEALFDVDEYEGIDATLAEKSNELIVDTADAFVSGIQWKAIYFMIGSAVVLGGVVLFSMVRRSQDLRSHSI